MELCGCGMLRSCCGAVGVVATVLFWLWLCRGEGIVVLVVLMR